MVSRNTTTVANVVVSDGNGNTFTTKSNGYYSFDENPGSTGVISPSTTTMPGYVFSPVRTAFSNLTFTQTFNFK